MNKSPDADRPAGTDTTHPHAPPRNRAQKPVEPDEGAEPEEPDPGDGLRRDLAPPGEDGNGSDAGGVGNSL